MKVNTVFSPPPMWAHLDTTTNGEREPAFRGSVKTRPTDVAAALNT